MIGLMGAHRTGKTTLARTYAEKWEIAFLETSVSAIFRDLGHDPAAEFDFKTRLDIQEEILCRLDSIYAQQDPSAEIITDRTPLDMLGYTMAEAIGMAVRPVDQKRFKAYTERCIDVTNRRFSTLVLVQPGIPLVKAKGKAAMNVAYIEHLNSLMLGLSVDERINTPHFYILRRMTEMAERLKALESAVDKSMVHGERQLNGHLARGGYLT